MFLSLWALPLLNHFSKSGFNEKIFILCSEEFYSNEQTAAVICC